MVPRLQGTDLSLISEVLKLSPAGLLALLIVLLIRGEFLTKNTVDRLLEARDKRYDLMMAEHMKAMEQTDKERAREREQSQARLDATIAHYEARLAERDTLLKENTALLTRAVTLLNGQQKPAA